MHPPFFHHTRTHEPQGKEFVLSSSPSALPARATTEASVPTAGTEPKEEATKGKPQREQKQEQQAPAGEDKAAGKKEGKRTEEEEEEEEKPADEKKPVAAPAPAAMVPAAVAPPKDFCHFPFVDIDPKCKRFISIDFRAWSYLFGGAGIFFGGLA